MLSESDKTWIVQTFGSMLAGFRLPLSNDRDESLKAFASELEGLLRPLVDEVIGLRRDVANLQAGINDAAAELQNPSADDWWKNPGSEVEE